MAERLEDLYGARFVAFGTRYFPDIRTSESEVDLCNEAKRLYLSLIREYEELVEDLSDGLVINMEELENIGIKIWFSMAYYIIFSGGES